MNLRTAKSGDSISTPLALTKAEIKKTKTGKPYLQVAFSDSTDTITGNIWDWYEALPATGIYDVQAIVGEYQGKKQLNNVTMQPSTNQDMSMFNLQFLDADAMSSVRGMLKILIQGIQHTALYDIVDEIYSGLWSSVCEASSAKSVHHVGIGGNLAHTCEVAMLAERLAEVAKTNGYQVSEDLCVAGALLHDIGKIYTYSVNGPVVEVTRAGALSDHIALGLKILNQSVAAKKYPETAQLLEHIILSHHGKLEYGSPVTPKFMEAYIVNTADGLSANLAVIKAYNDKADAEQKESIMTDKIFVAGNAEHLRQDAVMAMLLAEK